MKTDLSQLEIHKILDNAIEDDQFYRPVPEDETGFIYEIMVRDGNQVKRHHLVNIWIEKFTQEDPDLRMLRYYVRTMYSIQHIRISADLRAQALIRGKIHKEDGEWLQATTVKQLTEAEKDIEKRFTPILHRMQIWTEYLEKILGIGPRIGGSLIAGYVCPHRFDTASKMRKLSGLAGNVDGTIQRHTRGEKSDYDSELKNTLFKAVEQWNKLRPEKSGYKRIYLQFLSTEKERNANRPTDERITEKHCERRAKRRVAQIFINHLWVTWREMDGLPVRNPYPVDYLGHTSIIEPFTDKE